MGANENVNLELVMTSGLKHSAEVLSVFFQTPVELNNIFLKKINLQDNPLFDPSCKAAYKTEIKGDLKGVSYLLFNNDSFTSVNVYLSNLIGLQANDEEPIALAELDNIISAAVITKIADALKVFIYGDVPMYIKTSHFDEERTLVKNILQSAKNEAYYIESSFFCAKINCKLDFVWILNESVMENKSKIG